jgi:cysteine synthase
MAALGAELTIIPSEGGPGVTTKKVIMDMIEAARQTGTSSGANVVAAIQVAQRLGPGAKVVTLIIDSGLKYLNIDMYKSK